MTPDCTCDHRLHLFAFDDAVSMDGRTLCQSCAQGLTAAGLTYLIANDIEYLLLVISTALTEVETFLYRSFCTREQMVVFLHRLAQKFGA